MKQSQIEAWFDGAVTPRNPGGDGGYGMLVKRDGLVVHSEAVYIGRWPALSNNCAEYAGIISALRYLLREQITQAVVYGDSNMVVQQVNNRWGVRKGGAYLPYFHEAYALKQQLPKVQVIWVPREQNVLADALSKKAVTEKSGLFQLDPSIEPMVRATPRKLSRRQRYAHVQQALVGQFWDDVAPENVHLAPQPRFIPFDHRSIRVVKRAQRIA